MKAFAVISTTVLLLTLTLTLTAPSPVEAHTPCKGSPESVVHLTLLHFNDVYELSPLVGGTLGGLARVTTLRKDLLKENPNTFTFFGGDLYWPSAMGQAIVEGTPVDGEQTVAAMNTVGVDYMVFGDHELHVSSEKEFYQRLQETKFPILSANVFNANGKPFPGVAATDSFTVANEAGYKVRVGVFGITKPIRESPVQYTYVDPFQITENEYPFQIIEEQIKLAGQIKKLAREVDLLIALTHFDVREDIEIAKRFPDIDLILGGDNHEKMEREVTAGERLAAIYKSDSNSRSVYIIDVCYDTAADTFTLEARSEDITDKIPEDPKTKAVVDYWEGVISEYYDDKGMLDPLALAPPDFNGFADQVRNFKTGLTNLVTEGMQTAAPGTELALLYSFAIRLDDLIPEGEPVTEYDVLRIFPISDPNIVSVEIVGSLLKKVLDAGQKFAGSGCYLLSSANVTRKEAGVWQIDGVNLDSTKKYQVAMTDDYVTNFSICGPRQDDGKPISAKDVPLISAKDDVPLISTHCTTLRQAFADQLSKYAQHK